jgi:hypothetical protein
MLQVATPGGALHGGSTPGASQRRQPHGYFNYNNSWFYRNDSGHLANLGPQFHPGRMNHIINSNMGLQGIAHNAIPSYLPPATAPGHLTTKPVAPGDPFGAAKDSTYQLALAQAQRDFHNTADPLSAELAGLQSKRFGGRTLYDSLYAQAQDKFLNDVRSARAGAAHSGLLHSGAFDQQQADLGSGFEQNQRDLANQYGLQHQKDLSTQIGTAQSYMDEQRAALALAARERLNQLHESQNQAAYYAPVQNLPSLRGN